MMKNAERTERVCACCGKVISFVVKSPDLWAWKKSKHSRMTYYCSYGCMRKG